MTTSTHLAGYAEASMTTQNVEQAKNVERAKTALERAEKRLDAHRGWGDSLNLMGARVDAAAHRLWKAEEFGTDLPRIVAVLRVVDHGPCDDGHPSAYCPHCGSGGRYIHYAVTEDGRLLGAMSGCIQLFPRERKYIKQSKLVAEAFKRQTEAIINRRNLAGWWEEMITASDMLLEKLIDVPAWSERVLTAERRRQEWLQRNGYGRYRRGRR